MSLEEASGRTLEENTGIYEITDQVLGEGGQSKIVRIIAPSRLGESPENLVAKVPKNSIETVLSVEQIRTILQLGSVDRTKLSEQLDIEITELGVCLGDDEFLFKNIHRIKFIELVKESIIKDPTNSITEIITSRISDLRGMKEGLGQFMINQLFPEGTPGIWKIHEIVFRRTDRGIQTITIYQDMGSDHINLEDFLENQPENPQDMDIQIGILRSIIKDIIPIARALKDVDEIIPFVHRDLKTANLILTSKGTLHLTDFGLVLLNNVTRELDLMSGTFSTAAIEQFKYDPEKHPIVNKSDNFSMAVVIAQLVLDLVAKGMYKGPILKRNLVDDNLSQSPTHQKYMNLLTLTEETKGKSELIDGFDIILESINFSPLASFLISEVLKRNLMLDASERPDDFINELEVLLSITGLLEADVDNPDNTILDINIVKLLTKESLSKIYSDIDLSDSEIEILRLYTIYKDQESTVNTHLVAPELDTQQIPALTILPKPVPTPLDSEETDTLVGVTALVKEA